MFLRTVSSERIRLSPSVETERKDMPKRICVGAWKRSIAFGSGSAREGEVAL